MPPSPEDTPDVDRSAITGRFVSEEEAQANPDTTVSERLVQPSRDGRPQPAIGRIVHYTSYGTPGGEYKSECRAAIITATDPSPQDNPDHEFVSLCVLNPTGQFFNTMVLADHGDEPVGGTWHWPERV